MAEWTFDRPTDCAVEPARPWFDAAIEFEQSSNGAYLYSVREGPGFMYPLPVDLPRPELRTLTAGQSRTLGGAILEVDAALRRQPVFNKTPKTCVSIEIDQRMRLHEVLLIATALRYDGRHVSLLQTEYDPQKATDDGTAPLLPWRP